jgi:hypothetical protein
LYIGKRSLNLIPCSPAPLCAAPLVAEKGNLRKAIVQVLQNWIFFVHGSLKDDPRVEIDEDGDRVFLTLNEKGKQDSVEFFMSQIMVGPTKSSERINICDTKDGLEMAQYIYRLILEFQRQLASLKDFFRTKPFDDASLKLKVDFAKTSKEVRMNETQPREVVDYYHSCFKI